MKSIAIILTVVALAAPVCAQAAQCKAGQAGLQQKGSVAAANVTGTQPDDKDLDPYIVHG